MHDFLPKQTTERIHKDIEDMYELDPADRYSFIRTFMRSDEIHDLPALASEKGIASYYIQDFKNAEGKGVTRADLPPAYISGDHLFTDLKQCKILEIDTTLYKPYLRANLSECSVIVARNNTRLWAAHLGLSQVSQFDHALEKMHEAGFTETDCAVIASVGSTNAANNEAGFSPRLVSKEEYINRGFLPDAIATFEWFPPTTPEDRTQHGLCEVTIGPDGQLLTTFDADVYLKYGFMQEMIHQDTEKETFVPA